MGGAIKRTIAVLLVVGAVTLGSPAGVSAGPLDSCWYPSDPFGTTGSQDNSVHVNAQGAGSGDIICRFKAFSRGGVTAITPNKWQVWNETRNCLVADWTGGPVQSFFEKVAPDDIIRVTMFDDLQTGQTDQGTFGVIRAGGPGKVADNQPGCSS